MIIIHLTRGEDREKLQLVIGVHDHGLTFFPIGDLNRLVHILMQHQRVGFVWGQSEPIRLGNVGFLCLNITINVL